MITFFSANEFCQLSNFSKSPDHALFKFHTYSTSDRDSRVTLTQTSVYITHKNLAVRKIMEVMHTMYAKSGTWSQQVSNYTKANDHGKALKCCERISHIVCEQNFVSQNRLLNLGVKVLFRCHSLIILYFFSLASNF